MQAIFDEDSAVTVYQEEQEYKKWEREQKNKILAMRDPQKKQKMWRELFPTMTLDDEYLASNIF